MNKAHPSRHHYTHTTTGRVSRYGCHGTHTPSTHVSWCISDISYISRSAWTLQISQTFYISKSPIIDLLRNKQYSFQWQFMYEMAFSIKFVFYKYKLCSATVSLHISNSGMTLFPSNRRASLPMGSIWFNKRNSDHLSQINSELSWPPM
jgi:hypothetical protein